MALIVFGCITYYHFAKKREYAAKIGSCEEAEEREALGRLVRKHEITGIVTLCICLLSLLFLLVGLTAING